MVSPDVRQAQNQADPAAISNFSTNMSTSIGVSQNGAQRGGVPVLTLANDSLNIRIVAMNGAIIGRRKGPYTQFFEQHAYVSGVHAQLKYKAESGWCITDKHSSNGTKLNQRTIQPDVDMSLNNGDVLTIANLNLQVIIR
jgi:pSer/pThr/pTyr-binding forkhead associated (FHA) protein